jgi:hypothetical protein
MVDQVLYWEYTFLAEDDFGSNSFKAEYSINFRADKDGNDFFIYFDRVTSPVRLVGALW